MGTDIRHLIDLKKVDALLEGFNKSTGFVTAILDLEGNVLSKSGWRSICVEFHRVNRETSRNCTLSDTILANKIAKDGQYHFYKCLNGLVDVAVPVKIHGVHVANLFSGQFFFEEPDKEFFINQAKVHGFNEHKYLEALSKVPVVSKKKAIVVMDFLVEMTQYISEQAYQKKELSDLSKQLEESEAKFKSVFESANVGKAINTLTGEVDVNKSFCEMLGYDELEFKNKTWQELTPEDEIPSVQAFLDPLIKNEKKSTRFEKRYICKDKSIIWGDVSISAHHDKNGILLYLITTVVDITKRKQAEEEQKRLLASEQAAFIEAEKAKTNLSQILDSISDGFGRFDLDWNYIYANDILGQFLGKKPEELLGRNIWEVFPEAYGTEIHETYLNAMKQQRVVEMDHYYTAMDKWFQHRIFPSQEGLSAFIKDITESKLVEEKLKQQSSLVRIAAETAKLGGWNVDLKENRSYWSDQVAAIHEMPPGYAPLVEEGINFYAPEYREKIIEVFSDCANNGVSYDEEMQIITSSGKRVWIRTIGEAVRDENGKIIMVQGAFQDISEKKAAEAKAREKEERLRETETRFRKIYEEGAIGMVITSEDLKFMMANKTFCQMTGYPEHELKQLTFVQVTHPEDIERDLQNIKMLMSGKTNVYKTEKRYVKKTGEIFWAQLTVFPMYDSNEKFLYNVGIIVDVTDRKQAELLLAESEERYRNIIETAPVGIAILHDGIVVFANSGGLKILGAHSTDQLIGKHFTEIVHPDNRDKSIKRLQRLANGETGMYPIEDRYFKLDGSIIDVEVTATMLTYKNKPAVQVIITDITERKQLREELQQLNAELELKVKQRTALLEAANKELEAFSYSVSHDLRAPLRHINGYVELLNMKYYKTLDEEAKRYLNTISGSSKKLGVLIDDLLQFSRTSRMELTREEIDFNILVKEVLKELKPVLKDRNVKWDIQKLPIVQGDYALLKLVWTNLIDNAIKYTRHQPLAEISVEYKTDDTNYIFCVRDNGVGFDMKYAHKLFGVFQRLHAQSDFEGTGIGLANAQRIINKHSGKIWVEAELDKGAAFYFSLPKFKQGTL